MLKNYFKIAFRNLLKNKIFSFINILSLAIGLSASIVIGMMVYYDFTFDKFHPDGDRIYRVTTQFLTPDGPTFISGIPQPLAQDVEENFTGVESSAFIFLYRPYNVIYAKNENPVKEPTFITLADHNYFDVFKYKWIAGSQKRQLLNPNEVVLTQSRANQYFPNQNPSQIIGKTLIYNDSINTTITGIVADFEQRTDLVFQEFISLATLGQTDLNKYQNPNWINTNSSAQLIVKLEEGTRIENFQSQLNKTAATHDDQENRKKGKAREFYAQPLADLHFDQQYGNFDYTSTTADKSIMFMLGVIALFLLLLGCVNFINLNTAQASQRSKEIGIRKTLGSSKNQLIAQFLGETFILTIIAALFSLVLSVWLIHIFSEFIAGGVTISMLADPYLIGFFAVLIISVTLLAGFYPGVVLSKFKPVLVLKGDNTAGRGKDGLRKFLTVFQFTIAFFFVIATLLVGKQIHFLLNKDMGFKTESVIYLNTPSQVSGVESRELLAQKLTTISQIEQVSIGGGSPVQVFYKTEYKYQSENDEKRINIDVLFGDSKFLDLYDIQLIAGRLPLNDTIKEVVINKTAVTQLGFSTPQEAIGRIVNPEESPFTITGVMDDFQNGSLKNQINAMALTGDVYRKYFSQFTMLHVSIKSSAANNLSSVLTNIEEQFDEVYPDSNFEVNFMDEKVAQFYNKERSMSKLLNWSMGLSVLISCLGLLGLVIFNTDRRIKEIGIRKVLGATVTQINLLLCKEFLWLIGIAFSIATPIAYWVLTNWLQDFANKTALSWWIFALSGAVMIGLALIIMSLKTIKTAMENPVKSLRTE